MKVFVAGATGAIGKRLVPRLVAGGHEVVAMTRSPAKARDLLAAGAEPTVADGLDRVAVMQAVMRAEPEAVIHEMTSLSGVTSLRNFDRSFAMTNRLRTEGTDHLLEAAIATGARRFIAQSYGNWYAGRGTGPKSEDDPLILVPPKKQQRSFKAVRHLERVVLGADELTGVVLRYGNLYGPGTSAAPDGEFAPLLRKRLFPIVGDGGGVSSFLHVDDAATATIAALERAEAGIYNVADDDPAPVSEWLPELARALHAPPPRHVPVFIGRMLAGEVGVSLMTKVNGASNAKAKRKLGWNLLYPTWREGFRSGLSGVPVDDYAQA
ncbi:MAG TPA: NAD(P)-dependent oxidoreductase [Thermoleophilaceae bacterium]